MRGTALAGALVSLVLLVGHAPACATDGDEGAAGPAPAGTEAEREAEKAAAEARDAAAKAEKAAEEAARARVRALRAQRRALEERVRAAEDEADALRADGKAAEAASADRRLQVLYSELETAIRALRTPAAAPAAPVSVRVTAPTAVPSAQPPSAAFPPLARRTDNDPAKAVAAALDWLARHQSPGGSWDCDGFAAQCRDRACLGAGGPLYDPGVTGLALLPYLGAGETHRSERYGAVVSRGLRYLRGIQDAEGCFGPRTSGHFVYDHALATLAMADACAEGTSPLYRASAQQAVDFAVMCRNPYMGWRYGVRPQDNDTSVTGLMVLALREAKTAGLEVDDAAFRGALAWFDKVTDPETGRAGYTARGNGPARPLERMDAFPCDRSESLTAMAVLGRLLCGQGEETEAVRSGLGLLVRRPPAWDESGSVDFWYWTFGTLATYRAGGAYWTAWSGALGKALLPTQRGDADGCARGSWDPVDPWGAEGGRVASTAMNALCLEVYARYARVPGLR